MPHTARSVHAISTGKGVGASDELGALLGRLGTHSKDVTGRQVVDGTELVLLAMWFLRP